MKITIKLILVLGSSLALAFNSKAAAANDEDVEKPHRLYVEQFINDWFFEGHGDAKITTGENVECEWDSNQKYDHKLNWTEDKPSKGSYYELNDTYRSCTASTFYECTTKWNWPAAMWENLLPGTQTSIGTCSPTESAPSYLSPPAIESLHAAYTTLMPDITWGFPWGFGQWYSGKMGNSSTRSAQTTWKLFTGGKKSVRKENLFVISGSATEMLQRPVVPPFPSTSKTVPFEDITVGDMGKLGSDGRRYIILPDGETKDATPRVDDKEFYNFGSGASKHKLKIIVNGSCTLEPEQVVSCANYCVGQKLTFSPHWLTPVDGIDETTSQYEWDLPGNFVNESSHPCATCSVDWKKNPELLKQKTTPAWWASGGSGWPGKEYQAQLKAKLKFTNGQTADVAQEGKFTMHRPKLAMYDPFTIYCAIFYHPLIGKALGPEPGGGFEIRQVLTAFDGDVRVTQLVKGEAENDVSWSAHANYVLDKQEFFGGNNFHVYGVRPFPENPDSRNSKVVLADAAGILCKQQTKIHWDFDDYVRFKPSGDGANIFVTLGKTHWFVRGDTDLVFYPGSISEADYDPLPPPPPAAPLPRHARPPADAKVDPTINTDVEQFPKWEEIIIIHQK